uniref:Uncharacterized protein n=1 Tax=Lepeophtheirus salmonis TaxID=72036 RepID=A0A0K2TTQ0_LEPSM
MSAKRVDVWKQRNAEDIYMYSDESYYYSYVIDRKWIRTKLNTFYVSW